MDIEKLVRHLEVGQKVILKLQGDIVIGELVLKRLPSHLRLKDCRDYTTNEELGVNNIYYINEIRDIRVCDDSQSTKEEPEASDETKATVEQKEKPQFDVSVNIHNSKLNKIREMLNARIYIHRYDSKYFNACKDMMNQRQIGVCFEDIRFGRRSKPAVLAVSTDNGVYVFDLLLLDGINKELRAVFESRAVCKIVHYSKMTIDYLKHVYKIKVHFLFDTLMAYFYVTGTREVLTITELISKLFNLPQMEPLGDTHWDSRPITEVVLSQISFAVGFLIETQQYLMHRHLLRNFYNASGAAMYQFSNSEEFPYAIKPVKGKEYVNGLIVAQNKYKWVDLRENGHVEVENDEEKKESVPSAKTG